jgi:ketosteroid isomerase-like protein
LNDPLVIADRLFAAIQAGDVDAVRALYAPEAEIWHNTDGVTQAPEQNLQVLRWVVRHIRELRYEEVRRHATASGFVQQHVLRGTVGAGVAVEIPACIVCTVRDGRITRLDEYIDSAHVAPLLQS